MLYSDLPKASMYPSKFSLLTRFQVPLKSAGMAGNLLLEKSPPKKGRRKNAELRNAYPGPSLYMAGEWGGPTAGENGSKDSI